MLITANEMKIQHPCSARPFGQVPPPGLALRGLTSPWAVLRSWQALRFPNSLLAAVAACKNGVRRAHLVDARADGGLLLELYSRDGTGTMISTDFYECALLFVVSCLPFGTPASGRS